MKALLIQPPHYYGKNSRPPSAFPLGLAYIAAALKNNGHLVEVLDIYANQFSAEQVQDKIGKISSDIDIFCISALSTQYKYIKWLVQLLKNRLDRPIVLGNALATFSAEILFKNTTVDIGVLGEGEETMVDLLKNFNSLDKVRGICFRDNGNVRYAPRRAYIKDLDKIDLPLREIFPVDIYLNNSCLSGFPEIRAISIVSARGCPYNCNFCSKTFSGVRLRSVENVISEIELLRHRYNFKGVNFQDELTLVNKERVFQFCRYFKKTKLYWACQGRVDKVDLDLLKCMKDSGCISLGFGIESGSQKILDNMNKGITVRQAITAIKATKGIGIIPVIQMMYGYEGEDDKTLRETVDFFRRIKSPTMQFSMTTALPGTQLFEDCRKRGMIRNEDEYLEKLDWGYYADREVLINFTNFSINELIEKRKGLESEINSNYKKYQFMHPWVACKFLYRKIRSYYLRYGLAKTIKRIMRLNFNWTF